VNLFDLILPAGLRITHLQMQPDGSQQCTVCERVLSRDENSPLLVLHAGDEQLAAVCDLCMRVWPEVRV
jgi:hypothetical protein